MRLMYTRTSSFPRLPFPSTPVLVVVHRVDQRLLRLKHCCAYTLTIALHYASQRQAPCLIRSHKRSTKDQDTTNRIDRRDIMNDGWDDDIDLSQDVDGSGDGWGDDDDLNLDLELTSNKESNEADGWGDDDLNFDDDSLDPASTNPIHPPPPPPKQSDPVPSSQSVEADGWSDEDADDDLLNFDDGFNSETKHIPAAATLPSNTTTVPNDGWGDGVDDALNSDDEEQDLQTSFKEPQENDNRVYQTVQSGWESDDDFFGDDDDLIQPTSSTATIAVNPKREQLFRDLNDYVSSLDRMLSSINAVLDYEYNTPQKATELANYYKSRENLAEYTRSKEISRMDYRVVLPNGDVVMDKQQIASRYMPNESLLARCSNQSLLADLLQVISGKDLLVRPQFMAICVAHACKFTIHLADGVVDCACQLHLSMPKADGQRLNIANIHVSIVFAPDQPMVQYRVSAIDVLLKDYGSLVSTADFLMECQGDELAGEVLDAPADVYRDQFLSNSQKFFAQSTIGMKSALQEMESVVNFQQKLNLVRKLIPDTDALLAAEQEAAAMARGHENRPEPRGPSRAHQVGPPAEPGNRPTSILGGLVRSGWSKLANSVNLPDDDPEIYGHHAPPSSLNRRDEAPSHAQPAKVVQSVDLSRGFPRPPPSPAVPSKQNTKPADLAEAYPRGPPRPATPGKESQRGDTGNVFTRPLPSSAQRKTEDRNDGSFPRPPPRKIEQSKAIQDVDLSKGFPRPPPSPMPQQHPPIAPPTSRREGSEVSENVEDGWNDDSLDDGRTQLFDEQPLETKVETSEATAESSQPFAPQKETEEPFPTQADEDFVYNPEDDIVPTLKRWVNPRPHRPYVVW